MTMRQRPTDTARSAATPHLNRRSANWHPSASREDLGGHAARELARRFKRRDQISAAIRVVEPKSVDAE